MAIAFAPSSVVERPSPVDVAVIDTDIHNAFPSPDVLIHYRGRRECNCHEKPPKN